MKKRSTNRLSKRSATYAGVVLICGGTMACAAQSDEKEGGDPAQSDKRATRRSTIDEIGMLATRSHLVDLPQKSRDRARPPMLAEAHLGIAPKVGARIETSNRPFDSNPDRPPPTSSLEPRIATGTCKLDITVIDRDGSPSSDHGVFLASYDGAFAESLYDPSGHVVVRPACGRYYLHGSIFSGERTDRVVQPWLDLSGDRAVTLDARITRPIDVVVQRDDARLFLGVIGSAVLGEDGRRIPIPAIFVIDFADAGTAQIGPDAPRDRFVDTAQFTFAAAGADGSVTDSPYAYNLAYFSPGRAHTGKRFVYDAELAEVITNNRPYGRGDLGDKFAIASYSSIPGVSVPLAPKVPIRLPSRRTEFYSATNVAWQLELSQATDPSLPIPPAWSQWVRERTYRRGRRHSEVWNGGGVFGPSLPGPESSYVNAYSSELGVRLPLCGASAEIVGYCEALSASTTVDWNGTRICESDQPGRCVAEGKPQAGIYRVHTEAARDPDELSRWISVDWTFTYDGVARPNGPTPLPVQVIRFTPKLDENNTAPTRVVYPVEVTVQRNPGAAPADVASLNVEVSYDDGAAWQRAPVFRVGDRWLAWLKHRSSGAVSLRAKAVDTAGDSVEQTILRAYRLSACETALE